MKNFLILVLLAYSFVFLSGCSNSQSVQSLPESTVIDKVWVENNSKDAHDDFDRKVVFSIQKLGFEAASFDKTKENEHIYTLKYTVRWGWDLAVYLQNFSARLLRNGREIGSIEYYNIHLTKKFGRTMSKVDPLLAELFKNAKPEKVKFERARAEY